MGEESTVPGPVTSWRLRCAMSRAAMPALAVEELERAASNPKRAQSWVAARAGVAPRPSTQQAARRGVRRTRTDGSACSDSGVSVLGPAVGVALRAVARHRAGADHVRPNVRGHVDRLL